MRAPPPPKRNTSLVRVWGAGVFVAGVGALSNWPFWGGRQRGTLRWQGDNWVEKRGSLTETHFHTRFYFLAREEQVPSTFKSWTLCTLISHQYSGLDSELGAEDDLGSRRTPVSWIFIVKEADNRVATPGKLIKWLKLMLVSLQNMVKHNSTGAINKLVAASRPPKKIGLQRNISENP